MIKGSKDEIKNYQLYNVITSLSNDTYVYLIIVCPFLILKVY